MGAKLDKAEQRYILSRVKLLIWDVEQLGTDERLTEAQIKLMEAQELLRSFISEEK